MHHRVIQYAAIALILLAGAGGTALLMAHPGVPHGSAYDYSFAALTDDKPIALTEYQGVVIMVVNTASHCGFTPQYAALEKLYEKYRAQGFVIIGVPSNDFGGQEPGGKEEIAKFCQVNYGVTFPMAEKSVVSGAAAHPFYQWAATTLGFGTAPKWNFHKYLIDRHGNLVDYFNSTTAPDAPKLVAMVERVLAAK